MGFWSGFESLTGHQPGAFKGFTLKDIIDKDMWERKQRIRQQPGWDEGLGRYAQVGEPLSNDRTGQPMYTNWYKGRGKPELMGPVNPAAVTPTYRGPQTPGVASTRAAPWANIQSQMLRDPRQGPHPPQVGARTTAAPWANAGPGVSLMNRTPAPSTRGFVSPAVGMLRRDPTPKVVPPTPPGTTDEFKGGRWVPTVDKTTVVKKFADPNISDTQTTTIKEKLNQAADWQPEPGATARPFWGLQEHFKDWLGKFGESAGDQWGNLWDASVLRKGPGAWDAIKAQLDEARRKRYKDSMANKTWRGY